jgi:NAD(P)-dependent dehydrogenase (short-subunit alcohol dehydrogenase family)
VIVDVEATRAIRQAEVGAARTMLERTETHFGIKPAFLRPSLSSASGVIVRSATLWPATASPSSSTMPATPAPPEALVVKIESAGGRAVAAQADIANPAAVARLFDTAEAAYGGVDGVVNNAGIMQLATIAESDDAVFDRQIAINLKGVFNTLREASRRLPRMGRKNRLGARQRERLWQVFGAVLAELKAKSFQTDASIFTEAAMPSARPNRSTISSSMRLKISASPNCDFSLR